MSEGADPAEMLPEDLRDPIQAVGAAIAKHGYADLTTKKIAAESAKSEAALFRHFDSKDGLVEGFLDFATDWFRWVLGQTDHEDHTESLLQTCEVLMGDVDWELYPGFYVGIQEVIAYSPHKPAFRELLVRYHSFVFASVEDILERGITAGEFREMDTAGTAIALYTLADKVSWYANVLGMENEAERLRQHIYRYVKHHVVAEPTDFPRSC